jgi:quercetin dioxygenase-like cupin family protein
MEHITSTPTTKAPTERFTGAVYLNMIEAPTEPARLAAALVRFTPGARTNWHSHALGQVLYITDGVGLVGTRDGNVARVSAGEALKCPAGEEHWHGATDTNLVGLPDGEGPNLTGRSGSLGTGQVGGAAGRYSVVRGWGGEHSTTLAYRVGHGLLSASLPHSRSTCPGTTRPSAFQRVASCAKIGSPDAGGAVSSRPVTGADCGVVVVT